jgi:hypothetical protein
MSTRRHRGPPLFGPPPNIHAFEKAGVVRSGLDRTGIMIEVDAIDDWILAGGPSWNLLNTHEGKDAMQDVSDAYDEANEQISRAKEAYDKIVAGFRATIKNDMASISASADRVKGEAAKMTLAYKNAQDMLTTPEMERAILNAERLATALTAISGLENQSLTFAVIDKKVGVEK